MSVKRGKQIVFEGKLSSLRRVKDAVEEVSRLITLGTRVESAPSCLLLLPPAIGMRRCRCRCGHLLPPAAVFCCHLPLPPVEHCPPPQLHMVLRHSLHADILECP